jgi:large subunit ribosomal protein L32
MPNPKHKHSKTRRDKRRTHDALTPPALSRCAQCPETKSPHRICPHCGFYAGREVMEPRDNG